MIKTKPRRKRMYAKQILVNDAEHEFLTRYCHDVGTSVCEYGRRKMLEEGWQDKLAELRKKQKNKPVSTLDGRYKKQYEQNS